MLPIKAAQLQRSVAGSIAEAALDFRLALAPGRSADGLLGDSVCACAAADSCPKTVCMQAGPMLATAGSAERKGWKSKADSHHEGSVCMRRMHLCRQLLKRSVSDTR